MIRTPLISICASSILNTVITLEIQILLTELRGKEMRSIPWVITTTKDKGTASLSKPLLWVETQECLLRSARLLDAERAEEGLEESLGEGARRVP